MAYRGMIWSSFTWFIQFTLIHKGISKTYLPLSSMINWSLKRRILISDNDNPQSMCKLLNFRKITVKPILKCCKFHIPPVVINRMYVDITWNRKQICIDLKVHRSVTKHIQESYWNKQWLIGRHAGLLLDY